MRLISKRHNLLYRFRGRPEEMTPPDGFQASLLTRELLRELFGGATDTRRQARYARYLEEGCVGFVVTKGSTWAAAAWLAPATSMTQPDHVPKRVRHGRDWFFEDHTRGAFRGKGLHSFLINRRLRYLLEQSHGRPVTAFSDISPDNTASRRSYLKAGFLPAGTYTAWALAATRFGRLSPMGLASRNRRHPRVKESSR